MGLLPCRIQAPIGCCIDSLRTATYYSPRLLNNISVQNLKQTIVFSREQKICNDWLLQYRVSRKHLRTVFELVTKSYLISNSEFFGDIQNYINPITLNN